MICALVSLLFLVGCQGASQLTRTYDETEVLDDKYTLHWSIKDSDIWIGVEVKTTGWVGFGLAEGSSGSMPGSDVFTAWVDAEGKAHIVDRHAMFKDLPPVDECQDWVLVSGKEADGTTTIEVTRKLDTGDTQDRAIYRPTTQELASGVPLVTRIVYSFGTTDTVEYHGANRRATAVNFFRSQLADIGEDDEETYTVDYLIDWEIQPVVTHYVCQTYYLPLDLQYIVAIEAVLHPPTAKYVHHFAVMNNPENDTWVTDHIDNPTGCYGDLGFPTSTWTVWGWAPGTPKLTMPKNAGLATGVETGVFSVTFNVHYDNPELTEGLVDKSGFRITYTKKPRQYRVGTLTIGDSYISAPEIPAGQAHYGYDFECPSNCTRLFPNDINVFASWMHMHQLGVQAITTIHHEGAALEDYSYLSRVDFWDFNFQQTTVYPEPIVLKRGDRLNVHCYFNTTGRSDPTPMFIGSTDEMCNQILYYYPAYEPIEVCGFFRNEDEGEFEHITICGDRSGAKPWPNPMNPDPEDVNKVIFGNVPTKDCKATTEEESLGVAVVVSWLLLLGTLLMLAL